MSFVWFAVAKELIVDGCPPSLCFGAVAPKLQAEAEELERKSKAHSKARNSAANSGDAFAPARTFSRNILSAA